ncbi:MAG: CopG family transcriptional regulator [Vicinamibacterales bacterium]
MRTIVDLPAGQVDSLDEWCRREGVSRAEAVRRAVADYLRKHNTRGGEKAFGLWRGIPEGGLAYQERLRREWDGRTSE